MAVKTIFEGGSNSVLFTDRRDFYLSPNVVKELWTDVAPFTTFVANMEQRTDLKDPIFKMFEHRNPWIDQRMQVNSASAITFPTNDTSVEVPVSNLKGLGSIGTHLKGLVVSVHADSSGTPSGTRKGVFLIVDVNVAQNKVAVKQLGGLSGSFANNDWLVVIGNAHGEASYSPEAWSDELNVVYGSTQIFRTPIEISGTLKKAILRGEVDELLRLRRQKGMEHKIQKERTFIFGKSLMPSNLKGAETFGDITRSDADGRKVRTTTGILEAILTYGATSGNDQNIFDINPNTYSYGNFVDDMEKVFAYYPEEGVKYMFCGSAMLSYWSKLSGPTGPASFSKNSGWQIQLSDMRRDSLGFNYRVLETPHGILKLVHTPVLSKSPYKGYGIIVDGNNVFHAIYRPSQYRQNIKTDNGYDGQKDEYFSDEGIGITLIESHKVFRLV